MELLREFKKFLEFSYIFESNNCIFLYFRQKFKYFYKILFFKNIRINLLIFRVVVYNKNVAHFILILEYFLNKNFHLYLFFFRFISETS